MIELANGATIPEGSVVQTITCHMDNAKAYASIVERIQYDKTLPVIEACLINNGNPYKVPENAAAFIRLRKGDGKGVYNPALGLSEDREKVYITITQQMTAVPGDCRAVIEITADDGVICASEFVLKVTENPVQEGSIESENEFLTLTQILTQVQQMHGDVETWKNQTLENKNLAETAATNAAASAAAAEQSASSAQESAVQAAVSAESAKGSAAQAEGAASHYPTISADGFWQFWNAETGQYVKSDQQAQGPAGPQGPEGPPADTSGLIPKSEKGAAEGVATLDSTGAIPKEQIPGGNILQLMMLGEIPAGSQIQSGQDLNSYTTGGCYRCASQEIAKSLLNSPYQDRFKLIVDTPSLTGCFQYIIPEITNQMIYYRVKDISWSAWKSILSAEPGNTASADSALGLLGLQRSNKTLWSGSWLEGAITVPNFNQYKEFRITMEGQGTTISAYLYGNHLRGMGGYSSATPTITYYHFAATIADNTLTMVACNSQQPNGENFKKLTVSSIIGIC